MFFWCIIRSVFGGTVGPNPGKATPGSIESQFYDGIKVRIQPLVINIQTAIPSSSSSSVTSSNTVSSLQLSSLLSSSSSNNKGNNRRKAASTAIITTTTTTTSQLLSSVIAAVADNYNNSSSNNSISINNNNDTPPQPLISPASPILKAQLSAPPKQRDTTAPTTASSKGDMKSQVN